MHRRDFLLLRQPSSPRIVELSCERLHMSYLELQAATNQDTLADDELSFAEPAATLPHRDVDEWFRDLETRMRDADLVTVTGEEWLKPDALRARIDALLASLSQRGIRIQRR